MELNLQKSGDRLSLPIPPDLAKHWNLDEHSTLELIETTDSLILRKKISPPRLDTILASIPPDFSYSRWRLDEDTFI